MLSPSCSVETKQLRIECSDFIGFWVGIFIIYWGWGLVSGRELNVGLHFDMEFLGGRGVRRRGIFARIWISFTYAKYLMCNFDVNIK